MVVCNHILGGISEKHAFFLDKIMLNWGSELVFPNIKIDCKCSSGQADLY